MKISIAIPIHNMANKEFFLKRCIDSIEKQSFRDFEIVITEEGKMAENTNAAIKKCTGDIIKVLYMDDYLAHDNSLMDIVNNWEDGWLVTGCNHDNGIIKYNNHLPSYVGIPNGQNTIGSPSILAFENKNPLLFDEELSWMLDVDLYVRLYKRYGLPTFLNTINVTMGIGSHQMTNILTSQDKEKELNYFIKKYG